MDERLQKILARGGIASRRASESLILEGRVSVNGHVVTELGTRADPDVDVVAVDGRPVLRAVKHTYIMLNKPGGFVTTRYDPEGRPTIYELVPDIPGLFTVGRLDRETEGLLLLTTDGSWAEQVAHPRYEVEREYEVRVAAPVWPEDLEALQDGIMLEGKLARPLAVRLTSQTGLNADLTIVMLEGRKREVRMICASVGLHVRRLVRRRIGPVMLGWLAVGQWRNLDAQEVKALVARRGHPRSTGPEGSIGHGQPEIVEDLEAATGDKERMYRHRRTGSVGQIDDRQAPGGRAGLPLSGHGDDVSRRDEPRPGPRH